MTNNRLHQHLRAQTYETTPEIPSYVCYEELECFVRNGPMKHIGTLPATPEKIQTRFFAFMRASPKIGVEINPKLQYQMLYVAQEPSLVVLIHGFANDANKTEIVTLKDSLLEYSFTPVVIIVDWGRGAQAPWYADAAINTQLIGRQIAHFVNVLTMIGRTNPFSVHLIGFSLGAHVAGFAGKYSQNKFNWKFGRITALDAAGPLFEGFPGAHLTKADAYFVDAIHTSAGSNILKGKVGYIGPFAHMDFYPNNGTQQPRCQKQPVSITCDHNMALYYMESSLRGQINCSMYAFKCNSWHEFISGTCSDSIGVAIMGYLSVLSRK
ncbi:lipase member H-A-like [Oppia nitens]|uniref:lipase member H-A-like n=1 Tax=Oppia nitens TaxID=1686743 RepID=UPI0023DC3CEB|nr:lipase member H-A-like [Oppia nitens]